MKIAILAGPLDNQNAGIHVYLKELLRALAANPNRQHEYILIREQEDNDFPEFENVVLPIYALPGYLPFRLFFVVPWVCWRLGVDAVFEPAHFGPFNLPKRIKRITFIHDLTPILFPQFHTWRGSYLQKWFLPTILRKADLVITNSEHTKADVEKVYPVTKGKVERIYLGYADNFQPKTDASVLTKYGIQQPYFLNVGTIEPRKNLSVLLTAFEQFKKEIGAAHQLVFVGSKGWKCEAFFEQLENHPFRSDIVLPGYVEFADLPVLYTMCERFIYPSIYEGFGLPIVEARACGARCIVAKNSSLVEVGGEESTYFTSVEELMAALISVNGQKNSKEIKPDLSQFSWQRHQEAFEQALQKLA
ncbi:MAG: glycosyltransferase family 4 protein [Saprospiraceae bacterium]